MSTPICIISHERSGTHIAIDIIRNNFIAYSLRRYVSFKYLAKRYESPLELGEEELPRFDQPVVLKSHSPGFHPDYYGTGNVANDLFDQFKRKSTCIYVVRDPRDVIVSHFDHLHAFGEIDPTLSLTEYIRMPARFGMTPMEYWLSHVNYWSGVANIPCISFEDMRGNYYAVISKLRTIVPSEVGSIIDVRDAPASRDTFVGEVTSIGYNGGIIGRYRHRLTEADLALLQAQFNCSTNSPWVQQYAWKQ
ncbi:MAG: sulfotransferase domain-containing protein [Sulfuritalea sp.]|nr:sulfotransferase domain-containing protein [Sulfuritalea sp.]